MRTDGNHAVASVAIPPLNATGAPRFDAPSMN